MALTVTHYRPTDPTEAVEYDHFMRMLPELREQHPGDHVAVCGGEVIARGMFASRVHDEATARTDGRTFYIGFIDPHDYVLESGLFEVLEDA